MPRSVPATLGEVCHECDNNVIRDVCEWNFHQQVALLFFHWLPCDMCMKLENAERHIGHCTI